MITNEPNYQHLLIKQTDKTAWRETYHPHTQYLPVYYEARAVALLKKNAIRPTEGQRPSLTTFLTLK